VSAGGGAARPGPALAVLALCAAAFVAAAFLLNREGGFWSPDSALRYVQVESLLRSGFRDASVPYPAAELDPAGRFFPASAWFHFRREGRDYLSYPPYFPAASAVPYRIFGHYGLIALPVLGGLLAVWATAAALRRLAPELAAWGAAAVGLATPLLVYSGLFWDHSLAAALAAGAFAFAAVTLARGEEAPPRALLAAGALLGLGFWLRNEMYLLAAAVGMAWFATCAPRQRAGVVPLAVGAALAALPAWLMNLRLFGHPMGWKAPGLVAGRSAEVAQAVTGTGTAGWLAERGANLYHVLFALDFATIFADAPGIPPQAVTAGLLVGGFLVAAAWLFRAGVRRQAQRLLAAGALAAAAGVLLAVSGRTPLAGLLPTVPLVVLVALPARWHRWQRFVAVAGAAYVTAVVVAGSHAGLQWGPRYLLPVVPPLVWLAAVAVRDARAAAPALWPSLRVSTGIVAALGVLVQVSGLDHVSTVTTNNVRALAVVRSAPSDVVASAIGYLLMSAGPLYFEKRLMLVDTIEDLEALVRALAEHRVPEWTYVPRSGPDFDPRVVAGWTAPDGWRYLPVRDRLPYANLRVVTFRAAALPRADGAIERDGGR